MAGPIVCHSLDHAVAALRAGKAQGCEVTLLSAVDAAGSVGPGWFREMVAAARTACPGAEAHAILRCGDQVGHGLAALRAGVEEIALEGRPPVLARVAQIAEQQGGRLVRVPDGAVLDLLDEADPNAACLSWLGPIPK